MHRTRLLCGSELKFDNDTQYWQRKCHCHLGERLPTQKNSYKTAGRASAALAELNFDEDSRSVMQFDEGSSSEMEFDEDAEHFDVNDSNVHFVVRPFDDAAEKAKLILNKTLARMKKQDKGPTTEWETAYLVTLKSNLVDIFKPVYDLISDKCKRDDLGCHVYKPQSMEGPASRSTGCYKVQVAGGINKDRVKTG
jgi:hypothetical protein